MKYETYEELTRAKVNEMCNEITAPEHYNATGIEVIKVIETYAVQYPPKIIPHMANVLKYTCRAPYKGNLLKDLKKAQAYLIRAITTLEGEPRWE